MALTTAAVTFDLSNWVGTDFDPRRTKGWITTNVDRGYVTDSAANKIRVADAPVTINADGTGSATVWLPGADGNPTSWQTTFHFDVPRSGRRDRTTITLGPFTITAAADLADLDEEQSVPPTYASQLMTQLDEHAAGLEPTLNAYASAAATSAADAADSAQQAADLILLDLGTSDGQMTAIDANPASAFRTQQDERVAATIAADPTVVRRKSDVSAAAVNYTPAASAATLDATSGTHVAFPFTETLDDGTMIVLYRAAADHFWQGSGSVLKRTSTDDGATWSAASTVINVAGEDEVPGGIVELSDGTLLALIVRRPINDENFWYTQSIRSTDGGTTWDAGVTVYNGDSGFEYGTHVKQLADDTILAFLYCDNGGNNYVRVVASTDGGTTWASRSTILSGTADQHYQEPQAVVMPDGEILLFMRYEASAMATKEIRLARSTDDGVTWTTPATILSSATAQPAPHLTPDGRLVLAYRNASNVSRWATSSDRGYTWTTRGNFAGSNDWYVYGGWLDHADGDLSLVYALENPTNDDLADLYTRRFDRSPLPPRTLLAETTLDATSSTITFTSDVIPTSGFRHLELRLTGRTGQVSAYTAVSIQLNADATTANYSGERLLAEGATVSASNATANLLGYVAGATSTENSGSIIANLPNYRDTTFRQSFTAESTAPTVRCQVGALWLNIAAVTSVTVTVGAQAFAVGTVAQLYGLT